MKSIKFYVRRTLGETFFTFKELTTLLTQSEAISNSRPLDPLSDDLDDVSALTPDLTCSTLCTLPEPSLTDLAVSRLSRWQLIQQWTQHFWSQWSTHYLHRQQSISKWHHRSNEINPLTTKNYNFLTYVQASFSWLRKINFQTKTMFPYSFGYALHESVIKIEFGLEKIQYGA